MSDNRPNAYQEGRTSIYRASSIGKCLTALVAAKMGYNEAPSKYQNDILTNAAREGNLHEGSIVDTLINDYGWKVDSSQDLMEMQVIPHVIIRGHVDGICVPKGMRKPRVLEIKTMSDSVFKQWMRLGDNARQRLLTDRFNGYGWQISAYMLHFNMSAMYVVKNRNSGEIVISEVKTPPVDMKEIRRKVLTIERLSIRGEMPKCDAADNDQFFCPFPYLHDDDEPFGSEPDDESDPVDDVTEALLEGMAEHYEMLASKVGLLKPLDDERKDLGKKIVEAMGGRGSAKKREVGEYVIARTDSHSTYVDNDGVADVLGITVEEYKAILEKNKKERKFSFVKVTKGKGT